MKWPNVHSSKSGTMKIRLQRMCRILTIQRNWPITLQQLQDLDVNNNHPAFTYYYIILLHHLQHHLRSAFDK